MKIYRGFDYAVPKHTRSQHHRFFVGGILRGLAPDGGLFVPTAFPKAELEDWKSLSYPELAQKVLAGFLTDYDPAFLGEAAAATYGDAFAGKAGYVQKVHDGLYSLELWHGPTCASRTMRSS